MKNRYDRRKFSTGYCVEYAIALHRVTGLPIYLICGIEIDDDYGDEVPIFAHAGVSDDGGSTLIDASGRRDAKAVASEALFDVASKITRVDVMEFPEPLDMDWLESISGQIEDSVIEEALNIIKSEGV